MLPFQSDIGISKDTVEVVGDLSALAAPVEIDGSGLIASPGFIDMHSHADFTLLTDPRSESKVRQGVTTEVTGHCGTTPAPLAEQHREEWIRSVGFVPGELLWDWWSFADFLARIKNAGLGVNILPLVGHGAIRAAVMGISNLKAGVEQMTMMETLLSNSMDEGAVGLSTGLVYPPGVYADATELMQLARVAGMRGGFYFSHIRGEGATLVAAVEEALMIARRVRLPVQISHLKAEGRTNWDKFERVLSMIDQAQVEGLDVGADMYPYTAADTTITVLLPPWALAGGMSETLARLDDSGVRERIAAEMVQQGLLTEIGWSEILVSACPARPDCVGKYIDDLAEEEDKPALDCVLDLVAESQGEVDVILFSQSEENVRKALTHPAVMIGTDAVGVSTTGPLAEWRPHPRACGTFPRILGTYVRRERVLTLEEGVRKMTSLPASRLRLKDRGRLIPGYKADVVLFDPVTVDDAGEYGQPPRYPRGIEYVLINGELAVAKGEHTGNLPGRVLGTSDMILQQLSEC